MCYREKKEEKRKRRKSARVHNMYHNHNPIDEREKKQD